MNTKHNALEIATSLQDVSVQNNRENSVLLYIKRIFENDHKTMYLRHIISNDAHLKKF